MALGKASNFEQAKPDYDRLRTTLNNSRLQTENNAAWQTIEGLITASQKFQNIVQGQLSTLLTLIGADNQLPANTLIGRGGVSSGPIELLEIGQGLAFDGTVLEATTIGGWDLELLKLNSQDVANDTTLTDDDFLLFPVNKFDIWYINLLLLYAGNSVAGDYKFNFELPTVNGWYRFVTDNDSADAIQVSTGIRLAAASALNASVICGTDAAFTPRMGFLEAMFRMGADGNVQFQFALNSAAAARTARTYAGSILRAKLLSGVPIGQVDGIGGGGPTGGSGPGAGSDPPTVPLPNLLGVVEAYNVANPGQIDTVETDSLFMNGVVAAMQAVDARFGHNYKRGIASGQGYSTDVVSYYHGAGSVPPADGDPNVYVIDIVGGAGGPSPTTTWNNVTSPAAAGGYALGPV